MLTVEAVYPGATASVVEETIAAPIEQQVSGVENLRQLRSRCGGDGSYRLEVSFAGGTDLSLAEILIQNRVNLVLPLLPGETRRRGVVVKKRSEGPLMLICLVAHEARFDARYLGMFATIKLKDELTRLSGVGDVAVLGAPDCAVCIRLDAEKLAAGNLTAADVVRALEQQSSEATAGAGGLIHLTRSARGGLTEPEQLETIVIKADAEGRVTHLRDVVAGLEIGGGLAGFASLDGKPAAVLAVYRAQAARPRQVSAAVHAKLAELQERLPEGMSAFTEFDFTHEATKESPWCLLLDVNPTDEAEERPGNFLSRADQALRRVAGVRNVLALSEQPFDRNRDQPCLVVRLEPAVAAAGDREQLIRDVSNKLNVAEKAASIRARDLSGAARSPRITYPIDFAIYGPERSRLQELAGQLVARISQERRLTDLWAGARPMPALSVDIDRGRSATLGLAVMDIFTSIQAAFGSAQAGAITRFGRAWPVLVQVESAGRTGDEAWNRLTVRTDKGQMVPLRAVTTLRRENEVPQLERLNLYPAVSITANVGANLSLAEARFVCEHLAGEVLPKLRPVEYRLAWLREMPNEQAPTKPEPPPTPVLPPPVSVTRPVQREVAEYEEFTGRIEPALAVDIRPRVSGYLSRVLFQPGAVKKDDVLFEIDPRPRQAALDRAIAEYRLREAQLQAAALAEKRSRGLLTRGAVTPEDVSRDEAARIEAEAALGVARASRETAKLELEFTRIVAPFDGRIGQPLVHPGNVVRADEALLATLVSADPVYVYFDIDERTVLRLRRQERSGSAPQDGNQGQHVLIGLADEPGFPHQGRIQFAAARIDPATGTLRCRAILPNADGLLTAGMFARLRLAVSPPAPTLMVPERAVGRDQGKPFVLVVTEASVIAHRDVRLGPVLGGWRVVKQGVAPGEWVAIDVARCPMPGTKVQPQQTTVPVTD
jgi:RND family efflux transporter MFP subunit